MMVCSLLEVEAVHIFVLVEYIEAVGHIEVAVYIEAVAEHI